MALTRDEEMSVAAACLLRGVVYSEEEPVAWAAIRGQFGRLHDLMATLGLRLVVDDADAFAYLRGAEELPDGMPRLVRRHSLTRTTTMLLVRLRQRMIAADAAEATPRLIVTAEDLLEEARIYYPPGSTEERLRRDVDRLIELGYLKKLGGEDEAYEVRRIIKALVTADWLAAYADSLLGAVETDEVDEIDTAPSTESN